MKKRNNLGARKKTSKSYTDYALRKKQKKLGTYIKAH